MATQKLLKFTGATGKITQTDVSIGFSQIVSENLAVDASTTSAVFVDLLTKAITIAGTSIYVIVTFTSAVTNAAAQAGFEIEVDGIAYNGTGQGFGTANSPRPGVVSQLITGLAVGAHTVKIRWKTSIGTLSCNTASSPQVYHACLTLMEVA